MGNGSQKMRIITRHSGDGVLSRVGLGRYLGQREHWSRLIATLAPVPCAARATGVSGRRHPSRFDLSAKESYEESCRVTPACLLIAPPRQAYCGEIGLVRPLSPAWCCSGRGAGAREGGDVCLRSLVGAKPDAHGSAGNGSMAGLYARGRSGHASHLSKRRSRRFARKQDAMAAIARHPRPAAPYIGGDVRRGGLRLFKSRAALKPPAASLCHNRRQITIAAARRRMSSLCRRLVRPGGWVGSTTIAALSEIGPKSAETIESIGAMVVARSLCGGCLSVHPRALRRVGTPRPVPLQAPSHEWWGPRQRPVEGEGQAGVWRRQGPR